MGDILWLYCISLCLCNVHVYVYDIGYMYMYMDAIQYSNVQSVHHRYGHQTMLLSLSLLRTQPPLLHGLFTVVMIRYCNNSSSDEMHLRCQSQLTKYLPCTECSYYRADDILEFTITIISIVYFCMYCACVLFCITTME